MKKIIIGLFALSLLTAPAIVFGAADTLNGTGNTVGDGTHANGGPDLTFDVSPNVEISVYVTTTAYAMTSANTLTDTTNGLEYGTTSGSTGYAQRPKTTAAGTGPAATTAATALPGADWAWMGGS